MADVNLFIAFTAGVLSFLSPCVLPLVPAFLAYLSGTSTTHSRWTTFFHSVAFVLGFSVIFAILGVLLNTVLAGISYSVQIWLSRLGGAIIIFFALYILGLLKIPFLSQDHKLSVKKFKNGYVTSFVFGAAFAVGWTPCVGAILGSILALAISSPGLGFALLLTYALGLGLPFLVVGAFTNPALKLIQRSQTFLKYFNIVVGILLLVLGILVFTNNLSFVANALAWTVVG